MVEDNLKLKLTELINFTQMLLFVKGNNYFIKNYKESNLISQDSML
jgi:hypothetical protein